MNNQTTFKDFTARGRGKIPTKELDDFFAILEPVKADEMRGDWRGYCLPTGNKWEWLIKDYILFKWWGKKFLSQGKIKAFIFYFLGLKFNLPFCVATINETDFRNKKSVAIVYDYFPIIDYLRKVNENTMMGIMTLKGKTKTYFYLERL